jgi:hypothetical protein
MTVNNDYESLEAANSRIDELESYNLGLATESQNKSDLIDMLNAKLKGFTTQELARAAHNKYERELTDRFSNTCIVDVYDVLVAFNVTCPAIQHAVKKLLCTGIRGHKDSAQDLLEAKESITRAIELAANS